MSGINTSFVNKYIQLKNDGQLTDNKIKELANEVSKASENDTTALAKLKNEIFKDGRIDANESKLIFMIGFGSDGQNCNEIKKSLSNPTDDRVKELFDKGFDLGQNAVASYRGHSGNKATTRDVLNTMTFGLVNSAELEVKENNKGVIKKIDATLKSLETSSQRTDCVRETIKKITKIDIGTDKSQEVTEKFLNKVTGVTDPAKNGWDAINASKYNKSGKTDKLESLLKGYEDKALVVVGAHTYQFVGFNKAGEMIVRDPSEGNKKKVISKDNPSVTVYTQKVNGKGGDGGESGRVSPDSTAVGFNAFNRSKSELSSDTYDKTGESKNIRKLLVLVGDKDQDLSGLFNAIKSNNLKDVQNILQEKGINISNQELQSFITIMNEPVKNDDGKTTNMLSELKSLSTQPKSNQAKYLNGIEYSDVSLKDYFTKASPQAIFDIFKDMVAGKDGC
jgi:hypothetical protein